MIKKTLYLFFVLTIFLILNFGCNIYTTDTAYLYGSGWIAEYEITEPTNKIKFSNNTGESITSLKITSSASANSEPTWSSQTNLVSGSPILNTASSIDYDISTATGPTIEIVMPNLNYLWFKAENSDGSKYIIGSVQWEDSQHSDFAVKIYKAK